MYRKLIEEENKLQAALGLIKLKGKSRYINRKSPYQCIVLRKVFDIIKYPSQQTQIDLSLLLNLPEKSIKLWFQNERQMENKSNSKDEHVGFEINLIILYRICMETKREINFIF